ncbi:DinB family protein [Ascidiimonas aurantiaca]|uniref:DinB family protein n=1 Tax=Ascidiimonas aurantiaca TaxID=1685432 RepID=UPI0030EC9406
MKSFFHSLFDYNYQANKRLIEIAENNSSFSEKGVIWLSHIFNAHHIWNARITQSPITFNVWQQHLPGTWNDIHYENQRNSFEIISTKENFSERIEYKTTKGEFFTNTLEDILFHIINHSTHHRGQIFSEMRAQGLEPPLSDYILYKR